MIDVLYFSDKAVNEKLFARVKKARRLTLVTVLPPDRAGAKNPAKLEPFATLDRDFGDTLDQVLVVDEGKVEGMWRDPVVDLADSLHPKDKKAAYAAARGYLFVLGGEAKLTVKKSSDPEVDVDRLEKAIEKLSLKRRAEVPARAADPGSTVEEEPGADLTDAWRVLGLQPGASLADARKAWRTLLVQYHPDKVAHLAPEFRSLAENKTREIMIAWEQIQAELTSSG